MKPFNMTDEEKNELLKKHKLATKEFRDKQTSYKNGIQVPEKKNQTKKKS